MTGRNLILACRSGCAFFVQIPRARRDLERRVFTSVHHIEGIRVFPGDHVFECIGLDRLHAKPTDLREALTRAIHITGIQDIPWVRA